MYTKELRFVTHFSEGAVHFSYFYKFWSQKCDRTGRGGNMKKKSSERSLYNAYFRAVSSFSGI